MSNPKNILIKAINEHLLDRMNQLGFKFIESQLKFKRKKGNFSQEIWFRGARTNWGTEFVSFQCQVVIIYPKYKRLLKELGEKVNSSSSIIQGNQEPLKNLKGLNGSKYYDFVETSPKDIMDEIFSNLEVAGVPYFNANDTEKKIARGSTGIEKIDFNILIGDFDEATKLCENGFEEFNKLSTADQSKFNYMLEIWKRKYEQIKKKKVDIVHEGKR